MNPQEHHTQTSTLLGYQLAEVEGKYDAWTSYKATEEATGKQVAVLVFDASVSQSPQLIEALEDYAFQASRLSHVNIQQVLSFKNGPDGCILVKEYVEGTRLDTYLQQKNGVNWQHALRFLKQLLHGLDAAHEAGFMQCVPTPQSVVIARGNTAKLTDMGLQLIIRKHNLVSDDTSTADAATPYLAPESLREDLIIPNAASDIYSIGLLGYELVTGQAPSGHGESNYFVAEHLSRALDRPLRHKGKAVPERLTEIIQKATEHHAIHRYNNAEAMLEALEELTPTSAKPNVVYHKRVRPKRRRFRLSPVTLLLLVGLIGLLGAGYYYKPYLQKQNPFEALNPAAIPPERPIRTAGPLEAAAAVPAAASAGELDQPAADMADESTADTPNIPAEQPESPITAPQQEAQPPVPSAVNDAPFQTANAPGVNSAATPDDAEASANVAAPDDTATSTGTVTTENTVTTETTVPATEASTPETAPTTALMQATPVEAVLKPEELQADLAEETAVVPFDPDARRTLILTSDPGGAMVSIEGKAMGTTPFQLSNITSNRVDMILSLPGHKSIREQITLADNQTTELFFDLLPENRPLILDVFPWGNVYLDQELVAERVSGIDTLLIAPQNYRLSIEHPSFGVWEQQLEKHAAAPLSFKVDFTSRAAFHLVAYDDNRQAVPGEVIINGHNTRQTTPITIELPLGKHTIEVRAEGYEPIEITRHVEQSSTTPEPVKLQLRRK